MAYTSRQPKAKPVADQILAFLTAHPHQSAIDIANEIGFNYFYCREVAKKLVESGKLTSVLVGKSPHYSPAAPAAEGTSVLGKTASYDFTTAAIFGPLTEETVERFATPISLPDEKGGN